VGLILYTEQNLDHAWHFDCKQRAKDNVAWLHREEFRYHFEKYLDTLVAGQDPENYMLIKIYMPEEIVKDIKKIIEIETKDPEE
tara:strand:+ start:385 stop:636 length:252 start_codon:yes stop_codon:yes gene_type:complete